MDKNSVDIHEIVSDGDHLFVAAQKKRVSKLFNNHQNMVYLLFIFSTSPLYHVLIEYYVATGYSEEYMLLISFVVK